MDYQKEINLELTRFSNRHPWNTDAQGNSIEGGALNANYTLVDAVGNVCNQLGKHGYTYGKDFVWQDNAWTDDMEDAILIKYNDPKIETLLGIKK
jgi:hypothetical protein